MLPLFIENALKGCRRGRAYQTLDCVAKDGKHEMEDGLDFGKKQGRRIAYMFKVLCAVTSQSEHCIRDGYRLDIKEFVLALYEMSWSKE